VTLQGEAELKAPVRTKPHPTSDVASAYQVWPSENQLTPDNPIGGQVAAVVITALDRGPYLMRGRVDDFGTDRNSPPER
jgi:hypothetical protein